MSQLTRLLLVGAGVLGAVGGAQAATDLLANPSFNAVGPQGASTTLSVPGNGNSAAGQSAAAGRTTWVTRGGTVSSQLVASDLVPGGHMLQVKVVGGAGLVRQFITTQAIKPPELAYACVWIKLVAGGVSVGLGHGGNTHAEVALLEPRHTWQRLEVSNGVAPATELIVYPYGGGNAEFYVESAAVEDTKLPIGCQPQ
jgi:hypothetical protein